MQKIVIRLNDREKEALQVLSSRELRDPRDQIVYVLRQEFERRSLLASENPVYPQQPLVAFSQIGTGASE